MPGLVKIGKTTRSVEQRALELHQTGVPLPFRIICAFLCPDCDVVESEAHQYLAKFRVSDQREFFNCDIDVAKMVVDRLHRDQISCWLEMYLPGFSAVEDTCIVDTGSIHEKIQQYDISADDIAEILSELTADELTPAVKRLLDGCKRFELKNETGIPVDRAADAEVGA
jgi:hypothetical protein